MTINPFDYGNPITQRQRFFGRKKELLRIQDAIQQMRCISIVGERRIGKSSLLKFLTLPELIQQNKLGKDYVLCFADLQGFEEISPQVFWKWILSELSEKLPEKLSEKVDNIVKVNGFDTLSLRSLFEQMAAKKIIFLFDEFETILENPEFPKSFYGHLRWLTQNCSVSFITATRRELIYHCLDSDTKTSPFFNIFDNLVLRPFTAIECKNLVDHYLKDPGIKFIDSEIEKLIEISGGYPAFLQTVSSFLFWTYQTESEDTEVKRWIYVEENFRTQLNSHSEYFWDKSEEEEKILLSLLTLLGKGKDTFIREETIKSLYPRYKNDLLTLYNRSLLLRDNGSYRLFSLIFAEWILNELTDISQEGEKSLKDWFADYEKSFVSKGLEKIENEFGKINPKYWNLLRKALLLAADPKSILETINKLIS